MKIRNGFWFAAILALACGCSEEHPQAEVESAERVTVQRNGETLSLRKDVYLLSRLLSDSAQKQAQKNARREKMRLEAIARLCKKVGRLKDLKSEERAIVERVQKSF